MTRFIVGAEGWFVHRDETISFGINGQLKFFQSKELAETYLSEKEFDKLKVFKLEITEA